MARNTTGIRTRRGSVRVVLTSAPARAAKRLADALVASGAAACVTQVPGARSVYRWKGRDERAAETLLLVKTTARALPRVLAHLGREHPYETPELLVLSPLAVGVAYDAWIREACDGPARKGR